MTTIDPRQRRSIKKLQKAYLELLLTTPDNITIRDLCKQADVTRPTFYNSFTSILDLRNKLHNEILTDLKQTLKITNPKPIEQFTETEVPENMVELFNHILKNKHVYEILLIHKPDDLFIDHMKDILRKYIIEGIHYATSMEDEWQIEIPFAVPFITGAYYESIIWWIENEYCYSPTEMAKLLLTISLYGPFKRDD